MTTEAIPTLTKAGDLFKDLVWDNLVDAALGALFTALPILKIWPIGPIINSVVRLFADKLFAALQLAIDLQIIAFVNGEHRRAFDDASVKLKIIASSHGIESEEFKKARKEHRDALSKFVRLSGRS
jgi:hypothetical protein